MEIYAEISNGLAEQIEGGKKYDLPEGVAVRKTGRRAYFFDCDEETREELIEFLENNGISWQDNDEPTNKEETKRQNGMLDLSWKGRDLAWTGKDKAWTGKEEKKKKKEKDQGWANQY